MSVIRPDFYDFGISSSTAYALKRRTNKLEFTFYSSLIIMFPILVIEIAAQHDWDNRKTAIKNAPKQDH